MSCKFGGWGRAQGWIIAKRILSGEVDSTRFFDTSFKVDWCYIPFADLHKEDAPRKLVSQRYDEKTDIEARRRSATLLWNHPVGSERCGWREGGAGQQNVLEFRHVTNTDTVRRASIVRVEEGEIGPEWSRRERCRVGGKEKLADKIRAESKPGYTREAPLGLRDPSRGDEKVTWEEERGVSAILSRGLPRKRRRRGWSYDERGYVEEADSDAERSSAIQLYRVPKGLAPAGDRGGATTKSLRLLQYTSTSSQTSNSCGALEDPRLERDRASRGGLHGPRQGHGHLQKTHRGCWRKRQNSALSHAQTLLKEQIACTTSLEPASPRADLVDWMGCRIENERGPWQEITGHIVPQTRRRSVHGEYRGLERAHRKVRASVDDPWPDNAGSSRSSRHLDSFEALAASESKNTACLVKLRYRGHNERGRQRIWQKAKVAWD
ncbi:hypothetical protein K438DRAFT_1778247 [Mycena galopus ATCC 62051]|nr:hypothetical protein K438DRAFT_1778247 [Mycena galopus ATCC 62051]